MKQAIAGVTPATEREVPLMTVWPSVAAMSLGPLPVGLWLGRLYGISTGWYIFTVGNLMCLLTIPVALVLYFVRIAPGVATRYRVTNRRIIVQRGIAGRDERSIALDEFDQIQVVVQPGQAWYDAGDLVFLQGQSERFRLPGVSRPHAFRQVCLKTHQAYVGVKQALSACA